MSLSTLIAQVKSINSTRQDVGAAFDEVQDLFANTSDFGAIENTSTISTNSTSAVVMTGTEITITAPEDGRVLYLPVLNISSDNTAASTTRIHPRVNGSVVSSLMRSLGAFASTNGEVFIVVRPFLGEVLKGVAYTFDIVWFSGNSEHTHYSGQRAAYAIFLAER